MKKRHTKKITFSLMEVIIITLSFAVVSFFCCYVFVNKNKITEPNDLTKTYNDILESFYGNISSYELEDAAISGMMNYLNEKYSVYLDQNDTNNLMNQLEGKYKGIGILISTNDQKQIEVRNVYPNTPAFKSGIKEKDVILKVDDTEVTGYIPADVATLITGHDSVKLTISRNGEVNIYNININEIDTPVVEYKTIENNDKKIGYIYLSNFSKTSYNQFDSALNTLEQDNINSLIIDVRSNTGGYLTSVKDILSLFVKEGKVLFSLQSNDGKKIYYDETKSERKYPIIVLIDGASASASEVLASSLKESYGAILVGTTSYGKGTVQQVNTLSDDTLVKYTTANWFTPAGNSINEVGVTPGIYVELTKAYVLNPIDENDAQLQKAISILSK